MGVLWSQSFTVSLNFHMMHTAASETAMIALQRLLHYADSLPPEAPLVLQGADGPGQGEGAASGPGELSKAGSGPEAVDVGGPVAAAADYPDKPLRRRGGARRGPATSRAAAAEVRAACAALAAPGASDWPPRGRVEFVSVQLRYRPNLPLALRG